jgi:phosphoglycolate phosphatase-like HAD superfamily hydrolase
MKESIFFDLDGTLITCENKQKYALFSILKSYGYHKLEYINDWWELKRNGYSTEKALIEIGVSSAHIISLEWARIIEDFPYCYLDKAFEDSLSTLQFLKKRNRFKITILSARKMKIQPFQAIQRFGFINYIDDIIIVDPSNAVSEKAHFLKKYSPNMFIGDTESDYTASIKANIRFYALNRGQRSHTFLKEYRIPQIENNLKFLRNID